MKKMQGRTESKEKEEGIREKKMEETGSIGVRGNERFI